MQFAINNMTSVYIEEIYHIKFLSILIAPIPIYFHPAVLKIPCQFDDPKRNYFRKVFKGNGSSFLHKYDQILRNGRVV